MQTGDGRGPADAHHGTKGEWHRSCHSPLIQAEGCAAGHSGGALRKAPALSGPGIVGTDWPTRRQPSRRAAAKEVS